MQTPGWKKMAYGVEGGGVKGVETRVKSIEDLVVHPLRNVIRNQPKLQM